jgi:2-iminobutanoate/2-iminopropanoate deaminase
MSRRSIIATTRAPGAIGPYSQAVRTGNLLFVSGQIPLDPATGQLIAGAAGPQTRQVMENLRAVLDAAGSSLASVVKTTIYLTDLDEFATVNATYGEYFESSPPARATVQVAALPKGASVEIDAIAVLD